MTPIAEVPIEVEAGDDFGLSRVGIRYKVGDGPEETLHLADYADRPLTAQALATLYLEKHAIHFKDGITYHAFAIDNDPSGPHRVVSELRFIDILPFKQAYRLVDGESPGEDSLTLEELIARQRVNLSRTFVLERDRSIADAAAMRLATFEEELAIATAEFVQGLAVNAGPISSLDEALAAMRSATRALDAKKLPAARSDEETALKGLIAARENLRKLLTLSSAGQMSEFRKFDRQQVQKIRRPRRDKEEEELADLEEDLEELAKREAAFSEEIEARGGGGPRLDPPPDVAQAGVRRTKRLPHPRQRRPASGSAKGSGRGDRPRRDPVQEQRMAAAEAERLRRLAHKDDALTDLANRRLDAAAGMVEESRRASKPAGRPRPPRRPATPPASSSRRPGRWGARARELADRLARERDFAQAIARAERELGQSLESGTGSNEAGTTPGATPSAGSASWPTMSPPWRTCSSGCGRRRPWSIASWPSDRPGRPTKPARGRRGRHATERRHDRVRPAGPGRSRRPCAADRLDALAQDLESVRRAAVQPQLERLLAAEKQAARCRNGSARCADRRNRPRPRRA